MEHERLTEGKYYHIYNRGINRSNLFVELAEYEHFLALYDKYISPVAETFAWVIMPNHFHFVVRIKENMVYKYANPETNAVRSADDVAKSTSGISSPNAVRSDDADPERVGTGRFKTASTTADLSAPAGWRTNNINIKKRYNDKSWLEEHKWETIELSSADISGKHKKPVPHRHFAHLFNAYTRYFNNRTGRTGNLFERPFKRKLIQNEKYLKQVILYVHNNPIHHGFCEHLLDYPWSSYLACISEKPTKLKRENVLKLFEELEQFKKQHNQKIDGEKIEKYLELDEVDYTTKISDLNAVRSIDADRFKTASTTADLSACGAPDNVKNRKKETTIKNIKKK